MHTKKNINCFANSTVDIKEQPVVTKPKKKTWLHLVWVCLLCKSVAHTWAGGRIQSEDHNSGLLQVQDEVKEAMTATALPNSEDIEFEECKMR